MLIRRSHVAAAGFATLIAGILYYLCNHFLDGSCWIGMQLSQTVAKHEYCEFSNMDAFFRQSMNSYSNLAYFFLGMILILTGISDHRGKNKKNVITQFPALSVLFGSCLVYLCFGSTFFHASLTWPGQRFDMNGTYSITIILVLLSLYRLLHQAEREDQLKKITVISFFVLLLFFVYLHRVIKSTFLLPGMMLAVTALTIANYIQNKNFQLPFAITALVCLVVAFIFRQLDAAKIACDPDSLWQGHAAWHVLTGLSSFLLYLFYRSENTSV